jgi:hypothetical protein
MVKQAGRKRSGGGSIRRKRADFVENPGLKRDPDFTSAAKRALALRRFLIFLLAAVLVMIGLASVVSSRFF